ncbi:MAG TPA: TetR/AcrR family transcriptional regulator [Micromonosporaceae bacterium]
MSEPDHGRPTAGAELLWGLREQATRGVRPALSLPAIARAAIEIADVDGIDAISMQRVAAALNVTKMALYRYVTSKAELIAVMTETAVGEPPDLSAIAGWRPKLEEYANQLRATWQRHPWIPGVTVGNRFMGPQEVGWVEAAVRALSGTGLSGGEQMDAAFLLSAHVRNVQSSAGTHPWTSEGRLSPSVTEFMRRDRARFPALIAAGEAANGARHDNGWEFGLQRILDGLELFIDRRRSEVSADGQRRPR